MLSSLLLIISLALPFVQQSFAGEVSVENDSPSALPYRLGDPRNCEVGLNADSKFFRMEVLPGTGWDNLRNLDQSIVLAYNYTQCKSTNDRKFLIPDDAWVIPQQRSQVATYSEITDHIFNYTSMTSTTINAHASFGPIGGTFSSEFQHAKGRFYNDGTVLSRIQLRYLLYIVKSAPDAQLHPAFKSRLWEIAAEVQGQNYAMAQFLAQLLIRDYGTHYVHTVTAGAILAQEDFLKSSFVSQFESDRSKITASAHESFFGSIGMSVSHETDTATTQSYLNNITYSHTLTYGGPPYRAKFSVNDWEDGLDNALVAIDRDGDPLHYVITPQNVPEVPPYILFKVVDLVRDAIGAYYTYNTYSGCADPTAANFEYRANVDDTKSCKAKADNFTFGGVYQTCQQISLLGHGGNDCDGLLQKNPLTQDYTCPVKLGYTPVVLHVGYKSRNVQWHSSCGWFGWKRCSRGGTLTVKYTTVWCVALGNVPPQTGLLFGGVYTTSTLNPVTQKKSCPSFFQPMQFGLDGTVCISNDYELGLKYAEPFAGFDSCTVGNPLAVNAKHRSSDQSTWPKFHCPSGFSQHLAMVDENCDINYCLKAGILSQYAATAIKRPPFIKTPDKVAEKRSVGLFTTSGQLIIKEKTNTKPEDLDWSVVSPFTEQYYDILESTGIVNKSEIDEYIALQFVDKPATAINTTEPMKDVANSSTSSSSPEIPTQTAPPQAAAAAGSGNALTPGEASAIGISTLLVAVVIMVAVFFIGMKVGTWRKTKSNPHEVAVNYQTLPGATENS